MARGRKTNGRIVAQNRKARRDYLIESSLEAGIELLGSEVKSLRDGRVSLNESYAQEREGEIVLVNCYIGALTAWSILRRQTLLRTTDLGAADLTCCAQIDQRL